MLRPASGPLRVRDRDNTLTEFREFQDGELIAGTRYRVVRLIGVGGMGSVYEVEHPMLPNPDALRRLGKDARSAIGLVETLRI
jgi:hypothetical protein